MGMATMLWVTQSGVGVMTAAMTKMARTAYLKFLIIHLAVRMPILARRKTRAGVSNVAAMPNRTLMAKPKYSSTLMTGWKSWPTDRKKRQAKGKTTKYPKRAPQMKKIVVIRTNGTTYFFSFW